MNDFAIETVQSLFENMLNVPRKELETTVMRFREEVKNLGEPERFAVTGDLVLRVQELAWDLGNNFGLECMNLDELEYNLLDCESQMTEKEKRVFDCATRYSSRSASCSARNFLLYFVALYCSKTGRVLAY